MLHANDVAVLRAAKAKPELLLWNQFGYPAPKAVQNLAGQLKRDETDVYHSLKFLKSVDAFAPSFDPRKPLKPEGIFSLVDRLTNPNAKPIELPPIKKTAAYQIIDRAITEHVGRIPKDANQFTKTQVLDVVAPLVQAMQELAPMFPTDERVPWMNRVRANQEHLEKIVRGHQTEFSYAQLQIIAGAVIKDLHTIETELEKYLPDITPHDEPQKVKASALRITKSSEVEPELIEWLWKNRIPLGKLTLFSGNPDVGKSLVSLDVAARLSSGRDFPDGKNTLGACDVLTPCG